VLTVPLRITIFFALLLLGVPACASTIATCNANFTTCLIPENTALQLPFVAIAGDAVLTEPGSAVVSDVFRIFDNLINTGAGTGLGNMAFLYSVDDGPLPITYSANAVFLSESPTGVTSYVGNGTDYLLGVPEPATFELSVLACAGLALLVRKRRKAVRRSLQ
jgi:hypothetical protein